jgi:hypothetical protein
MPGRHAGRSSIPPVKGLYRSLASSDSPGGGRSRAQMTCRKTGGCHPHSPGRPLRLAGRGVAEPVLRLVAKPRWRTSSEAGLPLPTTPRHHPYRCPARILPVRDGHSANARSPRVAAARLHGPPANRSPIRLHPLARPQPPDLQTTALPMEKGSVFFAVDRQIGPLIREGCSNVFADVDAKPGCVSGVHETVAENVGMGKVSSV